MAEIPPNSKPVSRRGGARKGAGRKKKALTELRAELLSEADRLIVADLPALTRELLRLAHGGYERVEERWEPAGIVLIDAPLLDDQGQPVVGPNGKPLIGKRPAWPDKPADELVLVSRCVSVADADRAAIQYAMDRVLGRPKERQEITGKDGGPVEIEATHRAEATRELQQWRAEMTARLSSLPNAPPTAPTSSTPTG